MIRKFWEFIFIYFLASCVYVFLSIVLRFFFFCFPSFTTGRLWVLQRRARRKSPPNCFRIHGKRTEESTRRAPTLYAHNRRTCIYTWTGGDDTGRLLCVPSEHYIRKDRGYIAASGGRSRPTATATHKRAREETRYPRCADVSGSCCFVSFLLIFILFFLFFLFDFYDRVAAAAASSSRVQHASTMDIHALFFLRRNKKNTWNPHTQKVMRYSSRTLSGKKTKVFRQKQK